MSEESVGRSEEPGVFAPVDLESPSLVGEEAEGESPAFEVKFLLPEVAATRLEMLVRVRLAIDSHADPALNGAYRTTSLYTETPDFAVFRRFGEYGRTKFRIRRYGSNGAVFLERKDKRGDRVRKSRVAVPGADLAVLAAGNTAAGWPGDWFREQIARLGLSPVCRVSYNRTAYMGTVETGPVRVTFDRAVRGELATSWEVTPVREEIELLPGEVICEFKYRVAMPALFKEIVGTMELQPSACSKYRRFIQSTGIAGMHNGSANGDSADV